MNPFRKCSEFHEGWSWRSSNRPCVTRLSVYLRYYNFHSSIHWSPIVQIVTRLVPTFEDRGCHVFRWRIPTVPFSFLLTGAATFLSSSSSVVLMWLSGPVPDLLLLLRKSGNARNQTRTPVTRGDLWTLTVIPFKSLWSIIKRNICWYKAQWTTHN
jgi:hypothetical protein